MERILWNPANHTVSDIWEWDKSNRIELRPDFQRRSVWSSAAKIMLIDTILNNIPMPKIFVAKRFEGKAGNEQAYRIVIDGQQRISAILEYMHGDFKLGRPFDPKSVYFEEKFSDLDDETRRRFLDYLIDFNELKNATDHQQRMVYNRVNKYSIVLNKQELRKAEYPGDFFDVSEQLSGYAYFKSENVFTKGSIRRSLDVEFVSELLMVMLSNYGDKKDRLDDFYYEYQKWDPKEKKVMIERFYKNLSEMKSIFGPEWKIENTRFRQKSDFYTMFLVVDDLMQEKYSIKKYSNQTIEPLREDLRLLDEFVRPSSNIMVCSDYAMRCVSKTNSAVSRKWRHQFIKAILSGTYIAKPPSGDAARLFYRFRDQMADDHPGDTSHNFPDACKICEEKISNSKRCLLAWKTSTKVFQISNAHWIHKKCGDKATNFLILERLRDGKKDLFQ